MITNPVTPDRLKAVAINWSRDRDKGPWSGCLYLRVTHILFWRCEHRHELGVLALACAKVELERRREHLGQAPAGPPVSVADAMPVVGFPTRPGPALEAPLAFPVDPRPGEEA